MAIATRLFALIVLFGLMMPGVAQAKNAPAQLRVATDLSSGWRFQYGDADASVTTAAFNDSAWEQVSVPHTWNRVGEYALTRSPATNNSQGIGWYRLSYDAKPMAKGRRLYIDFAAVGTIADVWINGVHVGQHKGAFTRFRFDVTPQWKPDAKNLIVVRADNSKPAVGSSTEHVLPLAGDFFIYGGLYRGVQLIEANDVGIDLLDFGGPGVYVKTGFVGYVVNHRDAEEGEFAEAHVKIRLRNLDSKSRKLKLFISLEPINAQLCDPNPDAFPNCDTSSARSAPPRPIIREIKVARKSANEISDYAKIKMPRLWNGLADPYNYTASIYIFEGKRLIDSVTQSFGIRDFKFDPNTGLTLNGKPLKLHGVSRHQDRLGKGWTLSAKDHAEDMALMKEMGVNSVRMAHYPHADEWVEEADKAGMVVWAEVPYVTTPSLNGGEGSAEVFANAEQQTRELIRQQYNHPSIAMWAAGNEVDAGMLFGASTKPVQSLKLLQHINRIIKEEDPSRATVFADCCEDMKMPLAGVGMVPEGDKLAGATDLIGYNRYFGWYNPQPLKAAEHLAREMDKLHTAHPTIPISISEYGAGGTLSQHSDNIKAGFINPIGRPQTEEYQAWVHEQNWPVIRDRPYIFGSWVWNMFDFASDLRNEGDSVDINTKGLVSFDRTVKKDAFYYYKAQWNPEPMIHLTGKRYANRAYSVMDVKAYASTERATLSINGKFIGEVKCPDRICIWSGVALKPGPNTALATGYVSSERQGESDVPLGVNIWDEAIFYGPDPATGIRINAGDMASREIGGQRYGSDTFVTGGTPAVLNMGGFGSKRSGPPKIVTAPEPALYDYWREGDAFTYAVPLPNGKWTVTVHSFDPMPMGANKAVMSITANGKAAVPAFAIAKEARTSLNAFTKQFTIDVDNGIAKLDFAATNGKAVLAAIQFVKANAE